MKTIEQENYNAWVSPKGKIYPINAMQHESWILRFTGNNIDESMSRGWLRVTWGKVRAHWRWELNQSQKDAIWDICQILEIDIMSLFDRETGMKDRARIWFPRNEKE